jgi:hypothetical protein
MTHDRARRAPSMCRLSAIALLSMFCIANANSQISDGTRRAARSAVASDTRSSPADSTPAPASAAGPGLSGGVMRIDKPFVSLEGAPKSAMLPLAPPEQPAGYMLRTGEPIHTELKRWAEHYGWDFYWYHASSWKTLRETSINKGPVEDAVAEVIDILRAEGKPVQLRISAGNRVMEVLSTEVRND